VSAPIAWDELDDPELAPGRWDLRSIFDRLRTVGDLFAGILEVEQDLPPLD
jgi:bifunctional non-homologous end joining protein LigD